MFVIIGQSDTILTSPDSVQWTARDVPVGFLGDVAYGNGTFVITGYLGRLLTSPDGISWTQRTSLPSGGLAGVVFAQSVFLTVGSGGDIFTSSDGINWVGRTSGISNTLWNVAYTNGTFIAVGDNSTILQSGNCPIPMPTSVVSRKTHGAAGNFDINLPLTGTPGVECRGGGAANDYQVVFTFASAVTLSSAAVTAGTGAVSDTTGNGTTNISVNLTGVTNAQQIMITLLGVNNGSSTGDVSVQMGVLLGDTNGNRAVNSADISQTKGQAGQAVFASNFREDVNTNGSINASDISLVKANSGTSLP